MSRLFMEADHAPDFTPTALSLVTLLAYRLSSVRPESMSGTTIQICHVFDLTESSLKGVDRCALSWYFLLTFGPVQELPRLAFAHTIITVPLLELT